MILCSCNVLARKQIIDVAERLARERPGRPVTPARIFRELNAKAQCTTCFSLVRAVVAEVGLPFTCPEPLATEADIVDDTRSAEVIRFDAVKRAR